MRVSLAFDGQLASPSPEQGVKGGSSPSPNVVRGDEEMDRTSTWRFLSATTPRGPPLR